MDGFRMAYRHKGDGTPLVFLHGTGGTGAHWFRLAKALSIDGLVVCPDLIGFGATPRWPGPGELELEHQVRYLQSIIKGAERGPAHVVGHCYGAALAVRLYCAYPQSVASLTLVEPMINQLLAQRGEYELYTRFRDVYEQFVARVDAGDEDGAWRGFYECRRTPGEWDRFDERVKTVVFKNTLAAYDAIKSNLRNPTTLDECRRIAVPTLVVRGEQTTPTERRIAEVLHEEIPGSAYRVISDASHLVPMSHSRELADLLVSHVEASGGFRLAG